MKCIYQLNSNHIHNILPQLEKGYSAEEKQGQLMAVNLSEDVGEGLRILGTPPIKQAASVTFSSPSSSSLSPEPLLTPMPPPKTSIELYRSMLPAPLLVDNLSRPPDIAEGSEPHRSTTSGSSKKDSTAIRSDPNLDR